MGRRLSALLLFIFVLGLMFASPRLALAQVDLQIETALRSYPLSGNLQGEMGYGIPLWGNATTSSSANRSPWYGYVRPAIQLATTGNYNAGEVSLDFFPISFLGVKAGAGLWQMTAKYEAYDCELIQCKGKFNHQFIEAKAGFGVGPVFLLARGKIEDFQQDPLQQKDFIEPTLGMIAHRDGDRIRSATGVLGATLNDHWLIAAIWAEGVTEKQKGFSRTQLLTVNWKGPSLSLVVGAGAFESSIKDREFTAVGVIRWNIWPSIELL